MHRHRHDQERGLGRSRATQPRLNMSRAMKRAGRAIHGCTEKTSFRHDRSQAWKMVVRSVGGKLSVKSSARRYLVLTIATATLTSDLILQFDSPLIWRDLDSSARTCEFRGENDGAGSSATKGLNLSYYRPQTSEHCAKIKMHLSPSGTCCVPESGTNRESWTSQYR